MQNFQGSDWHRLIPAVQYCDFRRSSLEVKNGNALTLTNGFPVMSGKFSQGIYLGGQSYQTTNKANYLTFSRGTQISGNNYTNINTNQGTISFWFKPYISSGNQQQYFFSNGTPLLFFISSAGNLQFYINGTQVCVNAQTFTAGTWYYITIRWDCDTVVATSKYAQVFVNGSEVASYASTITQTAPGATFYIGSDASGNYPLNAILEDFAIWDRVLTDAEITDLYNSGTGKVASTYADSSLKLYLPFDSTSEYSGTGMGCSAGNMQTGNLVTDGNMETAGTAAWSTYGTPTLSKDTSVIAYDTQSLKIVATTDGHGARKPITVVSGTTYHVEFLYKITSGALRARVNDGTSESNNAYGVTLSNLTGGWTKFETEIKATGTTLNLVFVQAGATAATIYIDGVIIVASKISNGGFEGTYSGGLAPDWTLSAGTPSEDSTNKRSGTKCQQLAASSSIYQSLTFTSGAWVLFGVYALRLSGSSTVSIDITGEAITYTPPTTTSASFSKLNGAVKLSSTSFGFYLNTGTSSTVGIYDDAFAFELTSVDITLTYLAQADLFENNGTNIGLQLSDQLLSFTKPTSNQDQSILMTVVPNWLYDTSEVVYLFMDTFSKIGIGYSHSNYKFFLYVNGNFILSSNAYTSNTQLRTRIRLLVSIDYTNNVYELFENGVKVAGYYSAVTFATIGSTIYIGRNYTGFNAGAPMNIEKIVWFDKPIKQHQAISIDNAYEYAR